MKSFVTEKYNSFIVFVIKKYSIKIAIIILYFFFLFKTYLLLYYSIALLAFCIRYICIV